MTYMLIYTVLSLYQSYLTWTLSYPVAYIIRVTNPNAPFHTTQTAVWWLCPATTGPATSIATAARISLFHTSALWANLPVCHSGDQCTIDSN